MLRCSDNTLYTGITTDVLRRFNEHKSSKLGAKYTKKHVPVSIESVWSCQSRSQAQKLEYKIKHFSKQTKEALISNNSILSDLIENSQIYISESSGYKNETK